MEKWDLEELRQLCSFIQGGLGSVTPFLKQFPGLRLIIDTLSTLPNVGLAIQAKLPGPFIKSPFIKSPYFTIDSSHNGVLECLLWLNEQIEEVKPCCRRARNEIRVARKRLVENAIPIHAYCGCGYDTVIISKEKAYGELSRDLWVIYSKRCNVCGKPLDDEVAKCPPS